MTRFYGAALVLLGLHVFDAPLVMRFPRLVPWGFVFALSLEVVAGLGMVVLHYEQTRARLLLAERTLARKIVLNLVTNARDAIDGNGRISVALQLREAPNSAIVLHVVDNGAGMDAELLRRIFAPFFSTKGSERGTGLGLAAVEGAVTQLGGTIHVQSRPGEGTKFEVVLPRISSQPEGELD